jgi:phosphoadenosine phosphosulfate reductase
VRRLAEDVVAEAVERFHPRLVLACSFQKEESVLIDMLMRVAPDARVFTIDTGVLFPETYAIWQKVAALEQALTDVDAWITGIRREQAPTRANAQHVERDEKRGIWKFNPLAEWTDKDVWNYIAGHDLPYHPLHDTGYDSIGCAPCTLPGSGRDGRWAGTDKVECGIHVA